MDVWCLDINIFFLLLFFLDSDLNIHMFFVCLDFYPLFSFLLILNFFLSSKSNKHHLSLSPSVEYTSYDSNVAGYRVIKSISFHFQFTILNNNHLFSSSSTSTSKIAFQYLFIWLWLCFGLSIYSMFVCLVNFLYQMLFSNRFPSQTFTCNLPTFIISFNEIDFVLKKNEKKILFIWYGGDGSKFPILKFFSISLTSCASPQQKGWHWLKSTKKRHRKIHIFKFFFVKIHIFPSSSLLLLLLFNFQITTTTTKTPSI